MIIDQSTARNSRRQCREQRRGFTLIEVGLALLIFLFAAIIGGSAMSRIGQRARCDVFMQDLHTFAAAFQNYHRQQGAWPAANPAAAAMPNGMERFLKETNWLKPTPFGGRYSWIVSASGPSAGGASLPSGAIAVTAFSPHRPLDLSTADLLYVDEEIDDGNLATGNFRTGFNGWPVYFVKR